MRVGTDDEEGLETNHAELATAFAVSMRNSWGKMLQQKRERGGPRRPHQHVYAGSWRICQRRMVYEMTVPEAQPDFDTDTLAKFQRGLDRERELLIDLGRVGRLNEPEFEVIGQQERFELKDRKGRVAIVGKVDSRIKCRELGINAPTEIKAWHPNLVAKVRTFRDLLDNTWTRSGARQLMCYLFGANEPIGFMVLDRPGLPQLLPVSLYDHLDLVDGFLRDAEEAIDHVVAETLPDFIKDPAECKRCPFFGTICQPPIQYDGAEVITDDETLAELERWHELQDSGKLWAKIDKRLKDRFRGIEHAVAGEFVVTGKFGKTTTYPDMPDAVKEKYRHTDPNGKFTTTITRLSGPPETEEEA